MKRKVLIGLMLASQLIPGAMAINKKEVLATLLKNVPDISKSLTQVQLLEGIILKVEAITMIEEHRTYQYYSDTKVCKYDFLVKAINTETKNVLEIPVMNAKAKCFKRNSLK